MRYLSSVRVAVVVSVFKRSEERPKKSQISGFSLIELLVVVAIIGVLAVAGVVAYTLYLDSVKEEAVKQGRQQVEKAISEHRVVVEGDLSGQSWMDAETRGSCRGYVEALVLELNETFDNVQDPADKDPFFTVDPDGNEKEILPGKTLIFCADESKPISQTRVVTCSNTGRESERTTGSWSSLSLSDPISDPIPDGVCPHPGS